MLTTRISYEEDHTMSRFAVAIFVSTCISLVAATGYGQESEPSAYEHLKDLECFIGTWEGKSVIPESPRVTLAH